MLRGYTLLIALVACLTLAGCAMDDDAPPPPKDPSAPIVKTTHKTGRVDHPIHIAGAFQINPDCSFRQWEDVTLAVAPDHGTVAITHGEDYPNFTAGNVRFDCNKMKVKGTLIDYTPAPGFTGDDALSIDIISESGGYTKLNVAINVLP